MVINRMVVRHADGTELDLTDNVPKLMKTEPFEMANIENHVEKRIS